MSVYAWAMAEEFKGKIAFNCLWPRTGIATAAIANVLGGDEGMKRCRKPEIMADAAYAILSRPAKDCSGNFFMDDEVLAAEGVTDLDQYAVSPGTPLMPDFFVPAPGARTVVGRADRSWRRSSWSTARATAAGAGRRSADPREPRPQGLRARPAGLGKDHTPPANVTLADNVEKISRLLDKMEEPVVLVGHALGGVTISQTAEARRRKIKALVYVCGLMPPSGKASREMTAGDPDMLFRRSREVSPDGLTYTFARASCRRCSTRTSRRGPLSRHGAAAAAADLDLDHAGDAHRGRYGSVPRWYIECTHDNAVRIARQRAMVKAPPVQGDHHGMRPQPVLQQSRRAGGASGGHRGLLSVILSCPGDQGPVTGDPPWLRRAPLQDPHRQSRPEA
jgi:pimeloyl-ACP methyl ester carboxylesterase